MCVYMCVYMWLSSDLPSISQRAPAGTVVIPTAGGQPGIGGQS